MQSDDSSSSGALERRRGRTRPHYLRKGCVHDVGSVESSEDDAYDFILPPYNQVECTLVDEPELVTKDELNSDSFSVTSRATIHHVYESHYKGDGLMGGNHGAELRTIHSPDKCPPPLFRWM